MNQNISIYEEEQLQIILMNELKEKSLQEDRKLKKSQDIEYHESLLMDELQNIESPEIKYKGISLEEMRQIRIQRFSK
jgi:hypothetical protein